MAQSRFEFARDVLAVHLYNPIFVVEGDCKFVVLVVRVQVADNCGLTALPKASPAPIVQSDGAILGDDGDFERDAFRIHL